jgi:NAD(P)-dependent dehydrogenase (short-subunit alcohol dehydrogenase family)
VSKHAIEGFAKTLSEELEKTNIKVNTLDPGKMQTELRRAAYPAEDSSINPLPSDKSPAIVGLMGLNGADFQGQQLTLKG